MYHLQSRILIFSVFLAFGACNPSATRSASQNRLSLDRQSGSVLDEVAFGGALGFMIGSLMQQAETNAAARGENLACTTLDPAEFPDSRYCQPQRKRTELGMVPADSFAAHLLGSASMLPSYTLYMDGDTVGAIQLRLQGPNGFSRRAVEAHWDQLAPRLSEGSKAGPHLRTEAVVWAVPEGRDYARLECLLMRNSEMCTLFIGRMATPAVLERAIANWRMLTPESLRRP